MKLPSRGLALAFVILLILLAGAVWWVRRTTGEPTISFVEFREVDGQRVAFFSVLNPSSREFSYPRMGQLEIYEKSGATLKLIYKGIAGGGWSWDELPPHANAIKTAHLPPEGFAEWTRPFRCGVELIESPRERWAFLPDWLRSWLPNSMLTPAPRPTEPKTIWSELVTP